jgi:serum/glucocorticoid-regulated kinase 2
VNFSNFEFLHIIGRGGFGKVWSVKSKKTNKHYALKQMSKVKIIDKKSIKSINSERELLSQLYSPFIVNMHYAFQDKEYLYLVMDLLPGGDLRYHISIHKKFSEEQTRFFICGIILSLEYIHSNGIIHRDIKPENLVLDEKGYIRLTDFGIAKKNLEDNSSETSGTPGYMSPEVINSKNHSFPADYFALGVIGYEFMKGNRPYKGKNRKEIKEQMNERQAQITLKEIIKNNYENVENINEGENWSKESIDFINKLLIRNPEERLGFGGVQDLKQHLWLKYYPWNLMYNKALPPPFIPSDKGNYDEKYCKGVDYIGEETKLRYEEIFLEENYDSCFKEFYYNIDEDKKRIDEIIFMSNNKNATKESNANKNMSRRNIKINIDNNLENKIYSPKSKNKNMKLKEKRIKNNENKKSNFILINFNINNITNNNIERKKINNFFFNNKNNIKSIKSGRLNSLIKQLKNQNHQTLKSDLSTLSMNTNEHKLSKNKYISPKINYSIRLNDSRAKIKNGNDSFNYFHYNNSLIKKYNRINSSQNELLKKQSFKKGEKKKKIELISKNEQNRNKILSLSIHKKNNNNFANYKRYSSRVNNKKLNTLNESYRLSSHSRIINKINQKLVNNSLKNISSTKNIKSKKIIFNKKILSYNNIPVKKNKIPNKYIPICQCINNDKLKNIDKSNTLQEKSEFIN